MIQDIFNLIDALPEHFEQDGMEYHIEKGENSIKIEGHSSVKELVKNYKDNIKDLDDELFLQAVDLLKEKVDLQKFNDLLDLKHFTSEQASEVEEIIEESNEIIRSLLQKQITSLVGLYERF